MKIWKISAALVSILMICCGIMLYSLNHITYTEQDVVEINRMAKTCELTWNDLDQSKLKSSPLNFVVMNLDDTILFHTPECHIISENEAIQDRDTILNIEHNGNIVGKIIFENDSKAQISQSRRYIIFGISISILMLAIVMIGYLILLYLRVIRPFHTLKQFAQHVARGDLDFPLKMEKNNYFGDFTESLDLMREELDKAKENERRADESKKELVAQLSHDIKSPIACIKAVAELMNALSKDEKQQEQIKMILVKSDQVDLLISNMFHATLEELQELEVTPAPMESLKLYDLLKESDYNGCVTIDKIPECLIHADQLRLQQVFDNVISNSYKYAETKIIIESEIKEDYLEIIIKDFGQGIEEEDLPYVFMKFKRGKNAENKNGSGLGLYIAEYLIRQMGGNITCYNVADGFCIKISLLLEI